MITICFGNQKGGVAKTSTSATVCAGLQEKGYKVLAIDTDPQCSLTGICGIENTDNIATLYDVFPDSNGKTEPIPIKDTFKTVQNGFQLVPGDISFAGADKEFNDLDSPYVLKEALEAIVSDFDYCIIDTPPQLGIMLSNALIASNYIIIPTTPDYLSVKGLVQLKKTIAQVQKRANPSLKIGGILLTRVDRTNVSEIVADTLGTQLFKSTIRQAVALRECQMKRSNLFIENPKDNITQDYRNFISELISLEG